MAIPFVSDIIDGIKWLIDFFFHKAPKPVLAIFFLLLLAIVGVFMSAVFHLIGYHCYSGAGNGLEVVKVDTTEFKANWNIWTASNDYLIGDSLTICEAHPNACGEEHLCYEYARYNSTSYFYDQCSEDNPSPPSDCYYYLKSEPRCNNCTTKDICMAETVTWIFCGSWTSVCEANVSAYGLEDVPNDCNLPFQIGADVDCWIPPNYRWNSSTKMYDCADLSKCGDGVEIQTNNRINQLINSAGYTQVYSNSGDKQDINNMIYLKCNNNLNPEVTFFGLPFLNYQIWVIIFLIGLLGVLLFNLRKSH